MAEEVFKSYYDRVERHLKEKKIWDETIKKFPPKAIEKAVKRILKVYLETNEDPEKLDWGAAFEELKDYESIDSFIRKLMEKGTIPVSSTEEMYFYALSEAEKMAAALGKRLVEEKEYERLMSLRRTIKRLREEVRKLRAEKEKWTETEELMKKYKSELEELKKKIVAVPPTPPAPPGRLTKEEERRLEREFKGYLLRVIGRVPEEAMKEFEREISTLREAPVSFDAALRMILDLARDLAEKYAPPTVPPTVRPPEEVAPPVEVERVAPPGAPLEPMKFPRRLASSEVKAFWEVFKKRLEGMGLDPYEYMDYWIAFRDAWYSNWLAVLRAFENMIEDIRARKPVRFYPRVPPWKSARDAVLHLLATKVFTNLAQLVETLNAHGYYL
ncbi:MAG: hypothetical protein QXX41_08970, partial [Nitrososphaerota archaeon]